MGVSCRKMNYVLAAAVVGGVVWYLSSPSTPATVEPYMGPYRLVPGTGSEPIPVTHTFRDGVNTLFMSNGPWLWDKGQYTRFVSTDGTGWDYIGTPADFNINSYKNGLYHQNTANFYSLI